MPPQGGRKHPQQDFIQIDTTNILFIVGGSFAGLEDIITKRIGTRPLGFNNDPGMRKVVEGPEAFSLVCPEDLHQFGLIPEFIGRLPMVTAVHPLDRKALVRILTEPRNALTRQFEKLFELDGVELTFSDGALSAIADKAVAQGTGARGLRAIIEETLMDVMFDVPSREDVARVVVTREAITGEGKCEYHPSPSLIHGRGRLSA